MFYQLGKPMRKVCLLREAAGESFRQGSHGLASGHVPFSVPDIAARGMKSMNGSGRAIAPPRPHGPTREEG